MGATSTVIENSSIWSNVERLIIFSVFTPKRGNYYLIDILQIKSPSSSSVTSFIIIPLPSSEGWNLSVKYFFAVHIDSESTIPSGPTEYSNTLGCWFWFLLPIKSEKSRLLPENASFQVHDSRSNFEKILWFH